MKRMRWIVSLFISSFFLVVFLPFEARSASVDTPNNKTCNAPSDCNVTITTAGDRTMKVTIKSNPNLPRVDSGDITLNPTPGDGEKGEELAKRIVEGICSAAQATAAPGPFKCEGYLSLTTSCGRLGDPKTCCDPTFSTVAQRVDMTCSIGVGGFTVGRIANDAKVSINAKDGGGQLHAVNTSTNGGNTVGADLLPQLLIRVRPLAVNGVASFTVHHSQGGQNPRSFSIDTTGKSEQQIADEMQAGFAAMNLGLTTSVHQGSEAAVFSPIFDREGPFVRIANAQAKFDEIQVGGQAGQNPQLGMTIGVGIPALNEWGLVVVVGLLLVTGYALLRRWRLGTPA